VQIKLASLMAASARFGFVQDRSARTERAKLADAMPAVQFPPDFVGNRWRTLPMAAHASARRRFFRLSKVNSLPLVVRPSCSQDSGAETGAPTRARVE
jgi:hypothetical protein